MALISLWVLLWLFIWCLLPEISSGLLRSDVVRSIRIGWRMHRLLCVEQVDILRPASPLGEKIQRIVQLVLDKSTGLMVKELKTTDRSIDVTLQRFGTDDGQTDLCPSIEELNKYHIDLYAQLEADPEIAAKLTTVKVKVLSPGIGDEVRTARDFISFKGFDVIVHTKEPINQKTALSGSLVKRTDQHVVISQRGRLVSIPRVNVVSIKFPKISSEDG